MPFFYYCRFIIRSILSHTLLYTREVHHLLMNGFYMATLTKYLILLTYLPKGNGNFTDSFLYFIIFIKQSSLKLKLQMLQENFHINIHQYHRTLFSSFNRYIFTVLPDIFLIHHPHDRVARVKPQAVYVSFISPECIK